MLVSLFISNNNFLNVIFSASVTMLLDKNQFKNTFINWLTSSTLAIYVITDNELRIYLDPWLFKHVMNNPFVGYAIIIVLCFACLIVEKIRIIFFYPVMTMVNRKIANH